MIPRFRFSPENRYAPAKREGKSSIIKLSLITALLVVSTNACPAGAEHFYDEKFGRSTNVKSEAFYSRILGRKIRYSIYLPPGYFNEPARRFPIIYYLHGFDTRGIAYEDWLNWHLDEALDRLVAAKQVQEMVVAMPECFSTGIVVNWGRYPRPKLFPPLTFPFRFVRGVFRSAAEPTYLGTYLFLHRRDLTRSDYADSLTTEFFRHIEQNYRVKSERRFRAISGFSTGGYSALSIAFQNSHLFDSVSAHVPMLVSGSPFSPNAGELFVEFDPGKNRFVAQRFTINLLRRIFANEETWQANNPIVLAGRQALTRPSVYIDVAEMDRRKYDSGARELVARLRDHGTPVQFVLVEGLPTISNHTYPGFVNGKLIAKHAQGMSERELRRQYGWKNLRTLINPDVQRIEHSLRFHSREFSKE